LDAASLGGTDRELQAIKGQERFEIVSRDQAEDLEIVEDVEMIENSETVLEDSEGFSASDDSVEKVLKTRAYMS
jgi:hypothetical protein